MVFMINSKSVNDLLPHVRDMALEFKRIAEEELLIDELRITSTHRDAEYQNYLYAIGRNNPGVPLCAEAIRLLEARKAEIRDKPELEKKLWKPVTNAKAGYSWHNFALAFDVVPIVNGSAVWELKEKPDIQLWHDIGAIGEEIGLDWSGNWASFKEYAHFQHTNGKSMAQLRKEWGY